MEQTTCGPQSSSPILHQGPARRGRYQGLSHPSAIKTRPSRPPQPCSARARGLSFLAPLISHVQGPSRVPWGLCPPLFPGSGPSQARWADGHVGTMWARFTAWPARLLVLRWVSCQICPIIWTVEFNSHCVLTLSPANIAGRHPLHASRPLPSHMAHSYSKLKI